VKVKNQAKALYGIQWNGFICLRIGITNGILYRVHDNSLTRPWKKQARKHVRDARNFNNIETRAVIKLFFLLQGKAPKAIHVILTETLASFFPVRAKVLPAPL